MKPKTEKMTKVFFQSAPNTNIMNPLEMLSIRGGKRYAGPGKVREADIELPDLCLNGPGGVQESDLEQPDLTRSLQRTRQAFVGMSGMYAS